jgi:uncharacterized protein YebE (UPF0316 family)
MEVLAIFFLRVINNAIGTVRLIVLTRDKRIIAMVLGFIESLIFAITFGVVLKNLSDIPNLFAYSAGFAVGGYIGQIIEARFISGFVTVNIISSEKGHDIALVLREKGYGVTETLGNGAGGFVAILRSVVSRQQVHKILHCVNEVDTEVFVTVEDARAVHRGWFSAARNGTR